MLCRNDSMRFPKVRWLLALRRVLKPGWRVGGEAFLEESTMPFNGEMANRSLYIKIESRVTVSCICTRQFDYIGQVNILKTYFSVPCHVCFWSLLYK